MTEEKSLLKAFDAMVERLAASTKVETAVIDGRTFVGHRGGVMVCDQPNVTTPGYRLAATTFSVDGLKNDEPR